MVLVIVVMIMATMIIMGTMFTSMVMMTLAGVLMTAMTMKTKTMTVTMIMIMVGIKTTAVVLLMLMIIVVTNVDDDYAPSYDTSHANTSVNGIAAKGLVSDPCASAAVATAIEEAIVEAVRQ